MSEEPAVAPGGRGRGRGPRKEEGGEDGAAAPAVPG